MDEKEGGVIRPCVYTLPGRQRQPSVPAEEAKRIL